MKSRLLLTTLILSMMFAAVNADDAKPKTPPSGGGQMVRLEITGDHYMIQGLGALITGSADTARIQFISPSDRLPKEYQNVNLQTGDLIAMLNGKKVQSVKDFESRFEALAVGSEVKLGIRRGAEMVMASFKKPDPAAAPKGMQIMQMQVDGPEGQGGKGPGADIFLAAAGVGISDVGGKPTVVAVLTPQGKGITGDKPEAGDIVTKISGATVATIAEFREQMDKYPMGTDVTITLDRKGAVKSFTFTRGGGK